MEKGHWYEITNSKPLSGKIIMNQRKYHFLWAIGKSNVMTDTQVNLLTNCIIIDLTQGNELGKLDDDHNVHNNFDLEAEMQDCIEEELHIKEENQCLVNEQIIIAVENQYCWSKFVKKKMFKCKLTINFSSSMKKERESKLNTGWESKMLQMKWAKHHLLDFYLQLHKSNVWQKNAIWFLKLSPKGWQLDTLPALFQEWSWWLFLAGKGNVYELGRITDQNR